MYFKVCERMGVIEDLVEPYPVLIIPLPLEPYPALTIPLHASIFPNKLASNVPNNMLRNHPFCSLASFLIVSLTPSNNNPESSRALTIFVMSSISSFYIISVALWPDPQIFFMYSSIFC